MAASDRTTAGGSSTREAFTDTDTNRDDTCNAGSAGVVLKRPTLVLQARR
jgi:hypothetical protein